MRAEIQIVAFIVNKFKWQNDFYSIQRMLPSTNVNPIGNVLA